MPSSILAPPGIFMDDGNKPSPHGYGVDKGNGLSDGLANYWPMWEGAGSQVQDVAGRNHGTIDAATWGSGNDGLALVFPAQAPPTEGIDINPPGFTGDFTFIWHADAAFLDNIYALGPTAGGFVTALYFNSTLNQQVILFDGGSSRQTTWSDGTTGMHFWSWAWDATAEVVRFGRDGVFNGVAAGGFTFDLTAIDRLGSSGPNEFVGKVSQAMIFEGVVPEDQIADLANNPYHLITPGSQVFPPAAAAVGNPWYQYAQQQAMVS